MRVVVDHKLDRGEGSGDLGFLFGLEVRWRDIDSAWLGGTFWRSASSIGVAMVASRRRKRNDICCDASSK